MINNPNMPEKTKSSLVSKAIRTGLAAGAITAALSSGETATAVAAKEHLSTREARINTEVSQTVGDLTKRILRLKPSQSPQGGEFLDTFGRTLRDLTLTVNAETVTGSNQGTYTFNVMGPVNKAGKFDPNRVLSLTISAGNAADTGEQQTSYETITFTQAEDPVTGPWEVSTYYNNPFQEGPNSPSYETSYVHPPVPNAQELTAAKFKDVSKQAYELVINAEHNQAVGFLPPHS